MPNKKITKVSEIKKEETEEADSLEEEIKQAELEKEKKEKEKTEKEKAKKEKTEKGKGDTAKEKKEKEKPEKEKTLPNVQVYVQGESVIPELKNGEKQEEKDKRNTFIENSKIKIGDTEYNVTTYASIGKTEKEQKEELDDFLRNVKSESLDDKKLQEMSNEISNFKVNDGLEADAVVFKNGDDYIVAIKGDVYKKENGEIVGVDQEKLDKLISSSIEKFKEQELAKSDKEVKKEEDFNVLPDNLKDLEASEGTFKLFPDDEPDLDNEVSVKNEEIKTDKQEQKVEEINVEEPKLSNAEQDKFQSQLLDDIEKFEGGLMPDEEEVAPSLEESKELEEISDEYSINRIE